MTRLVLLSLKMTMNSSDSAGTTSSATPAAAALDDENNAFKNAAATSADDKDTRSVLFDNNCLWMHTNRNP